MATKEVEPDMESTPQPQPQPQPQGQRLSVTQDNDYEDMRINSETACGSSLTRSTASMQYAPAAAIERIEAALAQAQQPAAGTGASASQRRGGDELQRMVSMDKSKPEPGRTAPTVGTGKAAPQFTEDKARGTDTMVRQRNWKQRVIASFYDRQRGTVLGRPCPQWIGMLIGLAILYTFLFAIVTVGCMAAMMYTLNVTHPTWMGSGTLLGSDPSLQFCPERRTQPGSHNQDALLVHTGSGGGKNNRGHIEALNAMFKEGYGKLGVAHCHASYTVDMADHKNKLACAFPVTSSDVDNGLGACAYQRGTSYGYGRNGTSPCIGVRVNKLIGWLPHYYNSHNHIGTYIKQWRDELWNAIGGDAKSAASRIESEQLHWFKAVQRATTTGTGIGSSGNQSAQAQAPADCWRHRLRLYCFADMLYAEETQTTALVNNVTFDYYPRLGVPHCYYPYQYDRHYEQPVFMIRIKHLPMDTVVKVDCIIIAMNVDHSAKGFTSWSDLQGHNQFFIKLTR